MRLSTFLPTHVGIEMTLGHSLLRTSRGRSQMRVFLPARENIVAIKAFMDSWHFLAPLAQDGITSIPRAMGVWATGVWATGVWATGFHALVA